MKKYVLDYVVKNMHGNWAVFAVVPMNTSNPSPRCSFLQQVSKWYMKRAWADRKYLELTSQVK